MEQKDKEMAIAVAEAGASCIPFVGLGMWGKSFWDIPPEERGWMFWGEGAAQVLSAGAFALTFGTSSAVTAPLMAAVGAAKVAKIATVAGTAATTIYAAEAGYIGKELIDSHLANNAEKEAQIQAEKKLHDDEAKALVMRKEEAKAEAEEKTLVTPQEEKTGTKAFIGMLTLLAIGLMSKKPSAESFNEKVGSGNPPHDIETKTTKELAMV